MNDIMNKVGEYWNLAWTWVAEHPKTTVGVAIVVAVLIILN